MLVNITTISLFPISIFVFTEYAAKDLTIENEDQTRVIKFQAILQFMQFFCLFYAFFIPPLCCCANKIRRKGSKNFFSKYGRYINFFCLFAMFVILPVVSLIHNAFNFKAYFSSDNMMRPWNACYALMNTMLIVTYFSVAKHFMQRIR